ncbi:MAG: hypothetical protein H0T62_13705 [Parachlamydiaceae bacterium]|nr:hypothetical protein [Parachlamydiaceae bacterium]
MNNNFRLFCTVFASLATQFSYADSDDRDSRKPKQERRDDRREAREDRKEDRKDLRDDMRELRSEQRQERKDFRDNRDPQRSSIEQQSPSSVQRRPDVGSSDTRGEQRISREQPSQSSVQRRPDVGSSDNRGEQRHSREQLSQPSVQRRPDVGSRDDREQQSPLTRQPSVQRRPDVGSREENREQRPSRDQQIPSMGQPTIQSRQDVGSRDHHHSRNENNYRQSLENYERKYRNNKSRPVYSRDEIQRRSEELRSGFHERREFGKRTSDVAEVRLKRYHPGYRNWFNPVFFQRHNYYPKYWRGNVDWWRGAQWNQINYWLGWENTVYPIYYDVGGYPVLIDRNWQEHSAIVSYQDFSQLRGQEWLPLGVFALGSNPDNAINSDVYIQLAVDRRGNLSGTYYNASTDKSYQLEGSIDPNTQQAYWKVAQENVILEMETGVFNLTQDIAYVQLTFLGGIVQDWALVRVID